MDPFPQPPLSTREVPVLGGSGGLVRAFLTLDPCFTRGR